MSGAMQAWWQGRSDGERRTLALGGALLAVLLLAGGVIMPLAEQHRALAQRLPALRVSTAELEAQADEAAALRARAGGPPPGSLAPGMPGGAAAVRGSLEAAGLHSAGDSVQAQADGHVEIRLANVSFDAFLAWLASARSGSGIRPVSFEAEALEAPGMVRLHCVLATAGGRP